jgi:hypothetical protein
VRWRWHGYGVLRLSRLDGINVIVEHDDHAVRDIVVDVSDRAAYWLRVIVVNLNNRAADNTVNNHDEFLRQEPTADLISQL